MFVHVKVDLEQGGLCDAIQGIEKVHQIMVGSLSPIERLSKISATNSLSILIGFNAMLISRVNIRPRLTALLRSFPHGIP